MTEHSPIYKDAVVIFGGSGFIGTHLARHLSQTGHRKIISVDLKPPREDIEGLTYLRGDVRSLKDFDVDGPVSAIFNLAAVHTTPGHPDYEYYEANVTGATEVTRFARRNKVHRIIFTSSISVYGPGEDMKTEQRAPAPTSSYGRSKLLAEGIHNAWAEEDASNLLVTCRPAVIFGEGEGGNFTRLAKLLRRGIFIYPGRKDTIKACFYVKDLVEALLEADAINEDSILFNGSYPDKYQLDQIVSTFKKDHFPKAFELMVPRWTLMFASTIARPFSSVGLGIHPDRIMKLVKSTDVYPDWLETKGMAKPNRLAEALADWSADTRGTFV